MGSSLHNRIYLGGGLSRAQAKRLRVFKWLSFFAAVAGIAMIFLIIN
jgi:hypothetical protein